MNLDPSAAGGYIGMAVAIIAAAFERFHSQRSLGRAREANERAQEAEKARAAHDQVLAAKDELLKVYEKSAESWKQRHADEHKEFGEYREYAHRIANDANATIVKQAEQIAELKARTDITPILESQKQQQEINRQMMAALEKILERLDHFEVAR
jgi:hypothetical protein